MNKQQREIKFRAFDTDDKVWIENIEDFTVESLYERCPSYIKIMQFTGLKDHNGKDIFEGDICRQERQSLDAIFEVIFRHGIFLAKIKHVEFALKTACENDKNHGMKMKIVGNIYDNPELLKTQ